MSPSNDSQIFGSPASAGLSFINEPIFALSTPGLPAAIAIIRLTGVNCIQRLSVCIAGLNPELIPARVLKICEFIDPRSNKVIDEPLLVVFKGPGSFTGEDCAELHLHGSPYVVRAVFEILRSVGFREAAPGEFSRRAFLNGKMDLTQAEGLRDLINAQTSDQWLSARQLADGRLKRLIESLRLDLIAALAFLEARIDFPDEGETSVLSLKPSMDKARAALSLIQQLLDTFASGRVTQHGLRVALIGPPNAGKSTLLNNLIGRDRAIVSEIPGTTRDYIEEATIIRGHLVRLVDTAGIRTTDDKIELIGIEHSIRIANESDLILLLIPADDPNLMVRFSESITALDQSKLRKIRTKIDLMSVTSPDNSFDLDISAHTGVGVDDLKALVVQQFTEFSARVSESCHITNARHADALRNASEALVRFFALEKSGSYDEMLAFELQDAVRQLKTLIGTVSNDEVLEKIFSEFCVGK